MQPQAPRLLDVLRQTARARGHPESAISSFADWCVRFIRFHGNRHPRELQLPDVGRFLEHVAQREAEPLVKLAAARSALDFLYQDVLRIDLGELPVPQPPRLLDQVRQVMRVRHYSPRTEDSYIQWIKRYIVFHKRGSEWPHPKELGEMEVEQFLTDLAVSGHVSASTQNQSFGATSMHCGRGGRNGCRAC